MERKMRTFKQLEKKENWKELKWFSQKVTRTYIGTNLTQAEVARKNQITTKCCRQLMDYAIIHGYVTRLEAIDVKDKAMENSNQRGKEEKNKSLLHHESLIRQREEYLVSMLGEGHVKRIVQDIANNPHKPICDFTGTYLLESNRMTKLLIERAIVEVIVDDKTVELLEERNRRQKQNRRIARKQKERFEKLKEQRKKIQCPYTTNSKCYFNHKCKSCKRLRDYRRYLLMRELEEHVRRGDPLDYQG